MTPRFRFITPDEILVGVVHGNGGPVTKLATLTSDQSQARQSKRLHCYEPKPGHVAVYCEFTAESNGPATFVDLRNPGLVIKECV